MRFANRAHAGRKLARLLDHLSAQPVVVLGLPRGGVPVAFEVARRLSAPLEVLLVRKLGVPFQPELAMGAVGEGGVKIIDHHLVRRLGIEPHQVEAVEHLERRELHRQAEVFRQGRPRVDLAARTAVVVDDGIATGSTALAACAIVRERGAGRVVMAAPVAPRDAATLFNKAADEFIVVSRPKRLRAIGFFYADFRPTPESEVINLLGRAAAETGRSQ